MRTSRPNGSPSPSTDLAQAEELRIQIAREEVAGLKSAAKRWENLYTSLAEAKKEAAFKTDKKIHDMQKIIDDYSQKEKVSLAKITELTALLSNQKSVPPTHLPAISTTAKQDEQTEPEESDINAAAKTRSSISFAQGEKIYSKGIKLFNAIGTSDANAAESYKEAFAVLTQARDLFASIGRLSKAKTCHQHTLRKYETVADQLFDLAEKSRPLIHKAIKCYELAEQFYTFTLTELLNDKFNQFEAENRNEKHISLHLSIINIYEKLQTAGISSTQETKQKISRYCIEFQLVELVKSLKDKEKQLDYLRLLSQYEVQVTNHTPTAAAAASNIKMPAQKRKLQEEINTSCPLAANSDAQHIQNSHLEAKRLKTATPVPMSPSSTANLMPQVGMPLDIPMPAAAAGNPLNNGLLHPSLPFYQSLFEMNAAAQPNADVATTSAAMNSLMQMLSHMPQNPPVWNLQPSIPTTPKRSRKKSNAVSANPPANPPLPIPSVPLINQSAAAAAVAQPTNTNFQFFRPRPLPTSPLTRSDNAMLPISPANTIDDINKSATLNPYLFLSRGPNDLLNPVENNHYQANMSM